MNDTAKIHLSTVEMELVNNKEWIFTKQQIIEKVTLLLGELHGVFRKIVDDEKEILPSIFQKPGGKISKGENYKGLPYLILDYPAIFGRENIFAIRTMFWWGNFFSISLHLSGENFKKIKNNSGWINFFKQKDFFICINENEWEHDFQKSNFIKINDTDENQLKIILGKNFLKVAKKIELNNWNNVPQFLEISFEEIIEFIKINFPTDETVL